MLRERLIQCGWRDDLKEFCKDVIRRKGLEKVTIEELVEEITPKGRGKRPLSLSSPQHSLYMDRTLILMSYVLGIRVMCLYFVVCSATIPEDVKAELLLRIRKFLQAT